MLYPDQILQIVDVTEDNLRVELQSGSISLAEFNERMQTLCEWASAQYRKVNLNPELTS
jgi:hypothetical protein